MSPILLGVASAGAVIAATRRSGGRARLPLVGALTVRPPFDLREAAMDVLDRVWPARGARLRDRQLPDLLERVATALRSGQALGPAFVEAARSAPEPLRRDLHDVVGVVTHGAALSEALAQWTARPAASDAVRLTTSALLVGTSAGGHVARAVDRVAATLRERHELEREVHALATQARASAAVLAGAPVAFTALVATIEPRAVGFLLTSPIGLACLVGGLGLEAAGMAWMARIVRSAS